MEQDLKELFEKLEKCVTSAKDEMEQFENGKKAAATRLRKYAQEGKNLLQEIRVITMDKLKAMPTKSRS